MAYVSRKLKTPLQGALAGGGDPATSPLYVFGPFLRLIVAAGVAQVTFGASIWLVIFTIAVVSAMYRLVMRWVTDGSGGSGLSEEEFGPWAVKTNAAITFIEYTLTFLVSIAALVTFVADRFPELNDTVVLIENRGWIAIGVSVLTGWLVNRGPTVTARTFGPATGGVLILLWAMVVATILEYGLVLPDLDLRAFTPEYIGDTFAGYARILAVMTGIEIFANMVAAYQGPPEQRSRKAFGGLVIIMGTTGAAMLVVGPAIFDISDPFDGDVSVFTQTMDALLPGPLAQLGTIVSVAVLLSAAAASALGLQNLFVGLKLRHYVSPALGRLNRFGVADRPVWIEVGIVSLAFLAFGTHEETYLALYAAGVFILLAMTGWAASKRLARAGRRDPSVRSALTLAGTVVAALLTTCATLVIFTERFVEGAWTYLVLIPLLYGLFSYFRHKLGPPTLVEERVGSTVAGGLTTSADRALWEVESDRQISSILVPMHDTEGSRRALAVAGCLREVLLADLRPATVVEDPTAAVETLDGLDIETIAKQGSVAETICATANSGDVDLIVMATRGRSGLKRLVLGSVTSEVVANAHRPVLVVPPAHEGDDGDTAFGRILVPLDGSETAERVLPAAASLAAAFDAVLTLTHVPLPTVEDHGAMERYLGAARTALERAGLRAETHVGGHEPDAAIPELAASLGADLIAMATHGRGGMERALIGSVAETVVGTADVPVLLVPILERRDASF